jgi:hypothetical protein
MRSAGPPKGPRHELGRPKLVRCRELDIRTLQPTLQAFNPTRSIVLAPLILPPPLGPAVRSYIKVSAKRVALTHVRTIDGAASRVRLKVERWRRDTVCAQMRRATKPLALSCA